MNEEFQLDNEDIFYLVISKYKEEDINDKHSRNADRLVKELETCTFSPCTNQKDKANVKKVFSNAKRLYQNNISTKKSECGKRRTEHKRDTTNHTFGYSYKKILQSRPQEKHLGLTLRVSKTPAICVSPKEKSFSLVSASPLKSPNVGEKVRSFTPGKNHGLINKIELNSPDSDPLESYQHYLKTLSKINLN